MKSYRPFLLTDNYFVKVIVGLLKKCEKYNITQIKEIFHKISIIIYGCFSKNTLKFLVIKFNK